MSTKVVCPDCGGVIGELSPGDTPCRCILDSEPGVENNTPSDTAAIESPVKGEKLCVNCGKNVTGHRRVKDSRGYLCYTCAKAERAAEREGKVRCKECRKMIRPEGLVAYNGKMICRSCFGHHQEHARFKKKVSTKGYDEHEKRRLIVLAALFVVLGAIVAYSYFFKMRSHGSSSPQNTPPGTPHTTPAKVDSSDTVRPATPNAAAPGRAPGATSSGAK